MEKATVIIDNGTGYSKMGYAGNMEPSYIIPSIVATPAKKAGGGLRKDPF
jgi:actin-related protein 3